MATLYSDIILDHFRNPRNYGSVPTPDISYEDVNPLCGDRIRIELGVRGGIVEVARFKGDGCALSLAAASILTELIQGADVTGGVPVSTEQLLSYLRSDIKPARINCVLLPLEVLRSGIRIYNLGNSSISRESQQDD